WTGLAASARQCGIEPSGLSIYRLTLRPLLWALTQRRNHRIFQAVSEPEIALLLLEEWGIPVKRIFDLSAYKTRKYRVQYAETDFAFFSRMLEDAGIAYHHDTIDGQTTLVLSDAPHAAEPRQEPVRWVAEPNPKLTHEWVSRLVLEQGVTPARYVQRDVDYRRAPTFPLVSEARTQVSGVLARAERFHYVPGAFLFGSKESGPTPAADDRGPHRTDLSEGQRIVQMRLDAKRVRARAVRFETSARDLRPGMVLSILDHPRADLGPDVRLLIVSSELTGTATGDSTNMMVAHFADTPYRPLVDTPKPVSRGVESATVVGPAGEDIHTDEFGRVRVHFHWDREGEWNENDSCWIPVSQPWGGAGFGALNLPRIGQEVLVEFLGGNPDVPVVIGRVYTNTQKVPYSLPHGRTQSGWKSASSPSTGVYNEIMFEDAAGSELMRVQAERDRATLVKNDCSTMVGRNESKRVQNDRALSVANDDSTLIERDKSESVRRHRTVQVDGDSVHSVGRDAIASVGGSHYEWSGGDRRLESGGKFVAKIGNSSSYVVMTETFIILQADRVFINPGVDATLAAIEHGIAPKTADELAAEAATAQANAEQAFGTAAQNANAAGGGDAYLPYLDGVRDESKSMPERGADYLSMHMMTGETPATISGANLDMYRQMLIEGDEMAGLPPMSEADADAAILAFVDEWSAP
ncbi:MAG: type VI secretion system tip protein VgrG, partial [Polyangiaceae bacterium]|nr:type VI secretion system tip protein VgrG [Polyangiaceae bacterium]